MEFFPKMLNSTFQVKARRPVANLLQVVERSAIGEVTQQKLLHIFNLFLSNFYILLNLTFLVPVCMR